MDSAFRSFTAILAGFVLGFLIFLAFEYASIKIFPLPAGPDLLDPASITAIRSDRPIGANIIILVGWVGGTFAASFVATKLAQQLKSLHGLLLGFVFLAEAIVKMREIPHPLWFWVVGVSLLVLVTFLGTSAALPPTIHADAT